MDPALEKERYRRLSEHFQHFLDLPLPKRQKFITGLAVEDPDMAEELQALLRQPTLLPDPADFNAEPKALENGILPGIKAGRKISPYWIYLVGGLSVFLILLGGQYWALARLETSLKREAGEGLRTTLEVRVAKMRQWASGIKEQARLKLDDPGLADSIAALADLARDPERTRERLIANPDYKSVVDRMRPSANGSELGFAFLTPSGTALCSDEESEVGRLVSKDEANFLARIPADGWIISRPQPVSQLFFGRDAGFGRPVMVVAGPVSSRRGQIIAVGVIRIALIPSTPSSILRTRNCWRSTPRGSC
jgi:hypothetical protein